MVIIRNIQRLQCTFGEFEDSVQKVCFSIKEIWDVSLRNALWPHQY